MFEKKSGLIWIQLCDTDDIPERIFQNVDFEKSADDKKAWKTRDNLSVVSVIPPEEGSKIK